MHIIDTSSDVLQWEEIANRKQDDRDRKTTDMLKLKVLTATPLKNSVNIYRLLH